MIYHKNIKTFSKDGWKYDEPTVGIDIQSRKLILDSVTKLARSGVTILYTTHYIEEADKICTSVAFINKGSIIECGTKEDLLGKLSETNIVKIKLSKSPEILVDKIKKLEGVESCVLANDELIVSIDKTKNLIKELVETVSHDGCEILSITFEKPTMEKLYFAIIGYSIDEKGEIKYDTYSGKRALYLLFRGTTAKDTDFGCSRALAV